MPAQNALVELRRCAGLQFDPDVVKAFCQLVDPAEDHALDNVAFLRAAAETA
jgi:response regulator RpfG family c-di-GMP phosphodiesterase